MQTFKNSKQSQKEGKVNKPGEGSAKNRAKKWRQKCSRLAKEAAKGDTGALLATSSEIAPETPTTSYQSRVLSLPDRDDGEISSVAAITSCKAEEPAQPGVCRSDLSGAVLLLSAHLAQPEPASPEQDTPSIVKKQRPAFVNGNYCRYYGYRLAAGETEDPRLQVMEKRWFVNKRCLDIGCNEGVLTLAIASRFGCRSMLGMDIDEGLIKRACMALRTERHNAADRRDALLHSCPSFAAAKAANTAVHGLANVWFQQGNFVTSELEAESVDTITCMSVTKWIHLHGGDAAMHTLFSRVQKALGPGGYLILEPQPWKSYKQALRKLNTAGSEYVDLGSIRLRPEHFPAYLAKEFGFRLLKQYTVPSRVAGFDRPVYWFKKEDSLPHRQDGRE